MKKVKIQMPFSPHLSLQAVIRLSPLVLPSYYIRQGCAVVWSVRKVILTAHLAQACPQHLDLLLVTVCNLDCGSGHHPGQLISEVADAKVTLIFTS